MSNTSNNKFDAKALTIIPPKPNIATVTCKLDTGAPRPYIRPQDKNILTHRMTLTNGPKVLVSNGDNLCTIENAFLPLHCLLSTHAKIERIHA